MNRRQQHRERFAFGTATNAAGGPRAHRALRRASTKVGVLALGKDACTTERAGVALAAPAASRNPMQQAPRPTPLAS
eukprot:5570112-Alexandrium_andersonii.AAC.1